MIRQGRHRKRSRVRRYPCEELFTYGLWRLEPRPYDLGVEAFLRDMRRHGMNCLVAGPLVTGGRQDLARLRDEIALCRRYGVFAVPYFGSPDLDLPLVRLVVRAFKAEPAILGWYIWDEPPPEFLPRFLRCKQVIKRIAPRQPALCLFYRPDSIADFAPHQPILLTDCYPVAYAHSGTSLGPHFAARSGEHALPREFGQFNFWGRRGVLEWMDLCRAYAGNMAHWITLQVFESGDGQLVRWRQPTAPEVRSQVYMAIAAGAKGINFFRYSCITDDYGNPLPAAHGEQTPLWEEIGRLGGEITPLGPLLTEAEVDEPLSVVAALRPTPDSGNRVETRRLRSKSRDVDYIVALNNDVAVRANAHLYFDAHFLDTRRLYDLHTLQRVPTVNLVGGAIKARCWRLISSWHRNPQ